MDKIIRDAESNKWTYNGQMFDSKEEIYFSWYVDELVGERFVKKAIYQPKGFVLSLPKKYQHELVMKTKSKVVDKSLIRGHSYTPDWLLIWDRYKVAEYARGLKVAFLGDSEGQEDKFTRISEADKWLPFWFCQYRMFDGKYFFYSYVDVKGRASKHNSHRYFEISRKWVYEKYGVFVNKVVPPKLFNVTFCPERFRATDQGNTVRIRTSKLKGLSEVIKQGLRDS